MARTSRQNVAILAILVGAFVPTGHAQTTIGTWRTSDRNQVDTGSIQVGEFSGRDLFYQGQRIQLNIRLAATEALPAAGLPCPVLFLRMRGPSGEGSYRSIGGKDDKRCKVVENGGARSLDFGLLTDQQMREGEYSLEFLEFSNSGNSNDPRQMLATSPPFKYHLADVRKMPHRWEPQIKGLALDITLDKTIYKIGDEIPLHIARANLGATEPIMMPPCDLVQINIRDAQGDRVQYRDMSNEVCVSSSADLGPRPKSSPGDIIATERTMSTYGMSPGYYTLTGNWLAYQRTYHPGLVEADDPQHPQKPYAFVYSSPITVQIVEDDKHPWLMPPQTLTSLPGIFRQADTSFGPNTAMLDTSTGLKWLHLDLTQNWPIGSILNNMGPGELFAGWRYASVDEVRKMFATFLGNSDGRSANATAEKVLQSGLGGPLDFPVNTGTGWRRESSEGYARVDAEHFALVGYVAKDSDPHGISITIDPEIQGSSTTADQGFQQSGSGSYLVQDTGRR